MSFRQHSSPFSIVRLKFCVLCWQVYERGVAMFKWPNVFDIWNTYLTKFIQRYVSLFAQLPGFYVNYTRLRAHCITVINFLKYTLYENRENKKRGSNVHLLFIFERSYQRVSSWLKKLTRLVIPVGSTAVKATIEFYLWFFFCLFVALSSQGGKKLERARDLFEQVLEGCPAKFAKCKIIYLVFIYLYVALRFVN